MSNRKPIICGVDSTRAPFHAQKLDRHPIVDVDHFLAYGADLAHASFRSVINFRM